MSVYAPTIVPVALPQEQEWYQLVNNSIVKPGSFPATEPLAIEITWAEIGGIVDPNADYYPLEITLYMLRVHQRPLACPIDLERTAVGDRQYVSDHALGCWGSGESLDAAIEDYEQNLLDAYENLANAESPLSRLARKRLELLRSHLVIQR